MICTLRYMMIVFCPLFFCACTSLIGVPVIGQISMEMAGEISARQRKAEREDELNQKIKKLNDVRLTYEKKAQDGDPASQLMVVRTLRDQISLYTSEMKYYEFWSQAKNVQAITEDKVRVLTDDYKKYLQLALDQKDPSAEMYDLCIREVDEKDAWQPSQQDVAILENLAEMGKAHAKYLLATYVYSGKTASKKDTAKANRFLLDAFYAGDRNAIKQILLLTDTSRGRSSTEMIMAVATAESKIRNRAPSIECKN